MVRLPLYQGLFVLVEWDDRAVHQECGPDGARKPMCIRGVVPLPDVVVSAEEIFGIGGAARRHGGKWYELLWYSETVLHE